MSSGRGVGVGRRTRKFFPEPVARPVPDSAPKPKPPSLWPFVWRLAGECRIDPRGLSLRELMWMAQGAWAQAAAVEAAIWSANEMLKKPRIFAPAECNPRVPFDSAQGRGSEGRIRVGRGEFCMLKSLITPQNRGPARD
jgi:hypothetical protein